MVDLVDFDELLLRNHIATVRLLSGDSRLQRIAFSHGIDHVLKMMSKSGLSAKKVNCTNGCYILVS